MHINCIDHSTGGKEKKRKKNTKSLALFSFFLFPSIKVTMPLYPQAVIETVLEVATSGQAKIPTNDRDPDVIRAMTDMAVTHGVTKAHRMWLTSFSTTPSYSSFDKYGRFFKEAKAKGLPHHGTQ